MMIKPLSFYWDKGFSLNAFLYFYDLLALPGHINALVTEHPPHTLLCI